MRRVDFVKDYEELYDKTNDTFKDNAREEITQQEIIAGPPSPRVPFFILFFNFYWLNICASDPLDPTPTQRNL